MAPKRFGKANIQASKPELPPFLQRMKEQIVANEDQDRRERGEKLRKMRKNTSVLLDDDDDPVVVKIGEDDITEQDYKRMKHDLENNYKIEDIKKSTTKAVDIDVDQLIQDRESNLIASSSRDKNLPDKRNNVKSDTSKIASNKKKLSYSSDEDD